MFSTKEEQIIYLQNEIKMKDDELFDYKNQFALIKEREDHFLNEISFLQSNEKPELYKLQQKIKQLKEEYSQLDEQLHSELEKQDNEIIKLKNNLTSFTENVVSSAGTPDDSLADDTFENNLVLQKELQLLNDNIHKKQLNVELLQKHNVELSDLINNLRLEMDQVKENIEYKKQELVEVYDLMNTLREDLQLTKNDLECLKCNSLKVENSDSLFAEVNDRRLALKETLLTCKKKYSQIKQEVASKQKQITTLKFHNEELTKMLVNDPVECRRDYELLIETFESRILTLENLCNEYQKIISERQKLFEEDLPNNTAQMLNDMIAQNHECKDKLSKAIGMEFRAQKMMALQLKEINSKLLEWKIMTKQLQKQVIECSNTTQKVKCNSTTSESNKKVLYDVVTLQKNEDYKNVTVKETGMEKELHKEYSHEFSIKPEEKKVTFTEDTVDKNSLNRHSIRRGGKVLHSKSVFIPSLMKK